MEELLAKYFSGEVSADERSLVDSWRSESEENAKAFFESRIVWLETEKNDTNYQGILGSILSEDAEEEGPKVIFLANSWIKYAAAAVLFIAIGLLFILNQNESGSSIESLADGSEITLHGESVIEVLSMNETIREVKLVGKAYFDIERDEDRPFLIHTENAIIEVLGTSFVIDSDKNDTEVAVESGLVGLKKLDSDLTVKLEKGEIGLVSNSNEGIIKKANENRNYLSWKTKILSFKDADLAEVKSVLEDVYGITVHFENNELKNCKLTAKINKKKAKDAIEIIARTFNLEYDMKDNVILLKGRGC